MMSFEEFVKATIKDVEEEFKEYKVKAVFTKAKDKNDLFLITSSELPEEEFAYNAEEFYHMYECGMDYDCCLEILYDVLESDLDEKLDEDVWREAMDNFDTENVRFMLVNHKTEEYDLSEYPHRVFHDMAIMYYYIIDVNEEEILTREIDNETLEYFGLEERDLYIMAVNNMQEVQVLSAAEVMDAKPSIPSFMASEDGTICGSTALLNQNFLQEFAEHCDDDLYLCPVDKFTVFIFPAVEFEEHEVSLDAVLLNNQITPVENRLSNQIFYYDMTLGLMTAVTDFVKSVE